MPDGSGFTLYVNFFSCIKLPYADHVKLTLPKTQSEMHKVYKITKTSRISFISTAHKI